MIVVVVIIIVDEKKKYGSSRQHSYVGGAAASSTNPTSGAATHTHNISQAESFWEAGWPNPAAQRMLMAIKFLPRSKCPISTTK